MKGFTTALNIPDCHIPWHNVAAYEIMIDIAKDFDAKYGIDQINILGDFLDFYWVNLHPKLPSHFSVKGTFRDEVYIGIQKLKQLRSLFPNAEIRFLEGNHEQRLVRYLVKNAPALFDIVNLKELLKLDELGIEYIEYGKNQLVQCLDTDYYLRHVPYSQGKHCALGTIDKKHISLGFGHTHRKQSATVCDALGKELTANSLGWLGDRSAPVFSYMDSDDWSMGFEFVFDFRGTFHSQYIDIKNLQAHWEGHIYESDYIPHYNGQVT